MSSTSSADRALRTGIVVTLPGPAFALVAILPIVAAGLVLGSRTRHTR